MIRILIIDDHTMFADGINSLLASDPNIEVVGACAEGKYAIPFLREKPCDVVLLDINLPDINGIELCKRILAEFPVIKIIALSMFNEESYVREMLQHGAKGYILKNTGKDELIKAIQYVMQGYDYFSQEVTKTIMRGLMNNTENKQKEREIPKISRREQEVLTLIVGERTTQEIANQLYLSLKTVESHRSALLAKLNARNTAGLVKVAIEFKLV